MTELAYQNDTYRFEAKALVLECGGDENGTYVVLDTTIFHPQGGGQPSDTGAIEWQGRRIAVTAVRWVEGGVRHYGEFDPHMTAMPVDLFVDREPRLKFAAIHTAGHLLGSVIEKLYPSLVAVKGYHFPDSPYVEFEAKAPTEISLERVNTAMAEAIAAGASVQIQTMDVPGHEKGRGIHVMGFPPVPCGGTHLKSLGEIGNITATKAKNKRDRLRVSYHCA